LDLRSWRRDLFSTYGERQAACCGAAIVLADDVSGRADLADDRRQQHPSLAAVALQTHISYFGGDLQLVSEQTLWVPDTRLRSCDLLVLVEEASEPIEPSDVAGRGWWVQWW
jgi:hypothetical protein